MSEVTQEDINLKREICRALGLHSDDVTKLVNTMEVNDLTRVDITRFAHKGEVAQISEVVERYQLIKRES